MSASLVGSEMCIRDSPKEDPYAAPIATTVNWASKRLSLRRPFRARLTRCLLYTSDAADDM
eukprot:3719134-Alexandrium_andersonii.AAC.1